jgi:ribose transport system substrate-binding protein
MQEQATCLSDHYEEVSREMKHQFLKRRRSTMIVAFGFLALVVATSSFGAGRGGISHGATGVTAGNGLLIGESNPVESNPSQASISRGEHLAAKTFGWKVKTLDANLSSDKQVSDVDTLLTLRVAGIVTWTLDPGAVSAAYKRARAKGIPIVDFGSTGPLINTSIEPQFEHDCRVAQRTAAYIAQRVGKNAQVLVIGGPPVPALTFYANCFVNAAKAAGLVVAAREDNVKDTAATAQPIVESLLTKYPDTAAIWAYNDPSALGAGAVVRAAGKQVWMEGKQKGIIIVGTNATTDAAAGIKAGAITGTYDLQSDVLGELAIEALAVHLQDGKPMSAMPKLIVVPMKFWDSSNISGYVDPLKRTIRVTAIPKAWIAKK